MGQIRDLNVLHPGFIPVAEAWLHACWQRSIQILVVETRRTYAVMEAYYARGRENLNQVNRKYELAGLRVITERENRTKITNARPGNSWHCLGLAIDFVPMVNGKPDWEYDPDNPLDFYDEIAEEAEDRGMIWGGRFRTFPDRPHVEFHPGWTRIADAKAQSKITFDIPLKGVYEDNDFKFPSG